MQAPDLRRRASACLLAALLATIPLASYAQHGRGHGGGHGHQRTAGRVYRGRPYRGGGGGGGGGVVAGALLGLGVGALVGSALAQPQYAPPPPVAYYPPPPPGTYAPPPGVYYPN